MDTTLSPALAHGRLPLSLDGYDLLLLALVYLIEFYFP